MAKSSRKPKQARLPGAASDQGPTPPRASSADQRALASLAALDLASSERSQAAAREMAAAKSSRLELVVLLSEGWDAADAARRLVALDLEQESDKLPPRPALDETQIQEAQSNLNTSLPADYLEFCRRTGSARFGFGRRLGMRFIAANELASELKQLGADWPGKGELPIFETGGGEIFLLSPSDGSVRFLSLEGQLWPVAKSFAEVLEKLIEKRGELWWWLD